MPRVLARQKVAPRHARQSLRREWLCVAAVPLRAFDGGCARYDIQEVGRGGKSGALGQTEKQTFN
jgi:hypothetical protein